jgi:hypothetical protein
VAYIHEVGAVTLAFQCAFSYNLHSREPSQAQENCQSGTVLHMPLDRSLYSESHKSRTLNGSHGELRIVSEFGTGNHGSQFKRMVLGAQQVSFRHLVSVARHDHLIMTGSVDGACSSFPCMKRITHPRNRLQGAHGQIINLTISPRYL